MLAKKAETARSLPLLEHYQQQMMTLADCMDAGKAGASSRHKVADAVGPKHRNWLFIFVLSLVVAAVAWPVLALVFGKLFPATGSSNNNGGNNEPNDNKDAAPRLMWASGAIGALLLGVLTFALVRLIMM